MNLQELMSDLDTHFESDEEYNRDEQPVYVALPDGARIVVTGVDVEDACLVILTAAEEHDCSEGSYGGAEDGSRTRQDAVQGSIADRAGLSDLHRPQRAQEPSEGGQWSRVGDTDYG